MSSFGPLHKCGMIGADVRPSRCRSMKAAATPSTIARITTGTASSPLPAAASTLMHWPHMQTQTCGKSTSFYQFHHQHHLMALDD
jgi:hypothetical protein